MQDEEISIFPERRVTYATFWQRVGAYLLDSLILVVPQIIIQMLFGVHNLFLEIGHEISTASILSVMINSMLVWLYFSLMESSQSQATIGKQALGLKVTDINGNRISFGKACGRYFGKILSAIIIFIGFLMVFWDDRGQALHDKMAGTLVVKKVSGNEI